MALLGGNGTGKTTSLKLLAGLLRPYRGNVKVGASLALLPQDPQTLFIKKTVQEDLLEVFRGHGLAAEEQAVRFNHVVQLCRLESLLLQHPYDISGGEQQRCALAKLLLLRPQILLLDEPTKSLDVEFKQQLARILHQLVQEGVAVVMVSHDIEFCAQYAHHCALFFDGGIVAEGTPRQFFSGNSFYTTAANRMARDVLPQAVIVEDIIACCGKEPATVPSSQDTPHSYGSAPIAPQMLQSNKKTNTQSVAKSSLPQRTKLAMILVILLIPLTLFVGEYYLQGRKYYMISMLILLECMLPFFLAFEGRKPKPRELVLLAVLCAIGVAGRAICFMLPQFKPVAALTIIVALALGSEAGFLVGAVTMLVSNMLLSQGPWTPWQMFSMGIIGFVAGLLFQQGRLHRSRLSLCIFGALATIVLYGGIMNTSSLLMWTHTWNINMLLSYCLTGLPMDCVHGASTAFFLWIAAEPMLEKLERIKIKYGLIELKCE